MGLPSYSISQTASLWCVSQKACMSFAGQAPPAAINGRRCSSHCSMPRATYSSPPVVSQVMIPLQFQTHICRNEANPRRWYGNSKKFPIPGQDTDRSRLDKEKADSLRHGIPPAHPSLKPFKNDERLPTDPVPPPDGDRPPLAGPRRRRLRATAQTSSQRECGSANPPQGYLAAIPASAAMQGKGNSGSSSHTAGQPAILRVECPDGEGSSGGPADATPLTAPACAPGSTTGCALLQCKSRVLSSLQGTDDRRRPAQDSMSVRHVAFPRAAETG